MTKFIAVNLLGVIVVIGLFNSVASAATDLVVRSIVLNPISPSLHGKLKAQVTVKNRGSTSGDGGQLVVWVHQPVVQSCNAKGNKSITVGTIAAGESKVLTMTGLSAEAAGDKIFRAFVDRNCTTTESNDNNNQGIITYTVLGAINDTGIITCANENTNNLPCPVADYPDQDADHGRDINPALNSDIDGHAGFSFTKLNANGKDLPVSSTNWSCIRDNVTNLIWEIKTDDGGLRDKDNTYSWYNPNSATNGGAVGSQSAGSCTGGISCDTYSFVQAVNSLGLCGYNDWRMPSINELSGITALNMSYANSVPMIDISFFPSAILSDFWSGSPVAGNSDKAWGIYFGDGSDGQADRYLGLAVQLVRGGQ